jgi:hypothetical protein
MAPRARPAFLERRHRHLQGACEKPGAARVGWRVSGNAAAGALRWPKGLPMLKLYTYFHDSSSRGCALRAEPQGLPYESVRCTCCATTTNNRQQLRPAQPGQTGCPADGRHWLGNRWPSSDHLVEATPPDLPGSALDRAAFAPSPKALPAEMHPLNNLRVLRVPATQTPTGRNRQSPLVPPLDHTRVHRAGQ